MIGPARFDSRFFYDIEVLPAGARRVEVAHKRLYVGTPLAHVVSRLTHLTRTKTGVRRAEELDWSRVFPHFGLRDIEVPNERFDVGAMRCVLSTVNNLNHCYPFR